MGNRYLIIDGLLNSTGIRDEYQGGYLNSTELNLETTFVDKLNRWLLKYEEFHYLDKVDKTEQLINSLDEEGLKLAKELQFFLGKEFKVKYYSDAVQKLYSID